MKRNTKIIIGIVAAVVVVGAVAGILLPKMLVGVHITDHGTCKSVIGGHPFGRTSHFDKDDEGVYSYVRYRPLKEPHHLEWDWYRPGSGYINFNRDQYIFPQEGGNFAWTYCPLSRYSMDVKQGRWKVKFYVDDELIFTDEFTVE